MFEQVMALQLPEAHRQPPFPAHDLRHRDPRVVVTDPRRHGTEELEGPHMSLPEGLGALPFKGCHEHRVAVWQGHHEEGNLAQLPVDPGQRMTKIHLRFARHMLQRQEHLLPGLTQAPDGVLHRRVAAFVVLLVAEPFPDPLGGMPLLSGHLTIFDQPLLDPFFKRPDLRLSARLALAVARWLAVREDLLQRQPMHARLPQDGPLARPAYQHPFAYLSPLVHVGIHAPPLEEPCRTFRAAFTPVKVQSRNPRAEFRKSTHLSS